MEHEHYSKWDKDKSTAFKAKIGLWMFLGYSVVYAGFILINVIDPKLMAIDVGPLNLAIVYGFTLILLALIMALIYNKVCTNAEKTMNEESKEKESGAHK
ncbi:MAG: DUF485 domain-containing protein [Candidatus Humimicrobiaceae bacterium]